MSDETQTPSPSTPRQKSSPKSSSRAVDIFAAPKGGVGKTAAARFVAEYRRDSGEPLLCADTDPNNDTFAQVTDLAVEYFPAMTPKSELNGALLGKLFSRVATEDKNAVIDLGSPSFTPVFNYFMQSRLFEILKKRGRVSTVHAIITAPEVIGLANALEALMDQFPEGVRFVPWINEHFGELNFEATEFYAEHSHRFAGLIRLPRLNPHLDGACLTRLLDERLTFRQAIDGESFDFMSKLFLENYWHSLKLQFAEVL